MIKHFDFQTAAVTGATSTPALLEDSPLDALSFRERLMLWNDGNIDAPDLIVMGGVRAVIVNGCYEGTTARTRVRLGECL